MESSAAVRDAMLRFYNRLSAGHVAAFGHSHAPTGCGATAFHTYRPCPTKSASQRR
jgi:hypothetical protein